MRCDEGPNSKFLSLESYRRLNAVLCGIYLGAALTSINQCLITSNVYTLTNYYKLVINSLPDVVVHCVCVEDIML